MRNFSNVVESTSIYSFYSVMEEYVSTPQPDDIENIISSLAQRFETHLLDVQKEWQNIIAKSEAFLQTEDLRLNYECQYLSPSECSVLIDFLDWLVRIEPNQYSVGEFAILEYKTSQVFNYINLNTGSSLTCLFLVS